jgi:hypothetical protein
VPSPQRPTRRKQGLIVRKKGLRRVPPRPIRKFVNNTIHTVMSPVDALAELLSDISAKANARECGVRCEGCGGSCEVKGTHLEGSKSHLVKHRCGNCGRHWDGVL